MKLFHPSILLRLEGIATLLLATFLYYQNGFSWLLYGLVFFTPDFFMLGYVANKRVGAALYNFGHTEIVPVAIGLFCWKLGAQTGVAICLIWLAHVGFDRIWGYGLKFESGFKDTHLGQLRSTNVRSPK